MALSPLATNTNGAYLYECISHNTPENNKYGGNGCSSHHTYQGRSTRSGNWFHKTYPCEYFNNIIHTHNTNGNNQQTAQNARETVSEGHYLSSVMIEQAIKQAALTSVEVFNGTKCKFKALIGAIENEAKMSSQNSIYIAFSKLIKSPLLTANRLKIRSPNLIWTNLKKELCMQYSITPSETHTTQAFTSG